MKILSILIFSEKILEARIKIKVRKAKGHLRKFVF
ncbi:MAG: hypothetical protein RL497_370 [Pseudomonadota bacterium]|jgi:hypothetical protein